MYWYLLHFREDDLQRALRLSEQEEHDRAKAVDDANSRALFDDSLQTYINACLLTRFSADLSSEHLLLKHKPTHSP
jgi:hypothetical protein